MKLKLLSICVVLTSLTFYSCKKDKSENNLMTEDVTKSSTFIKSPVSQDLLMTYINYQTAIEANSMLKTSNLKQANIPILSKKEFNEMINNYLINERNQILINQNISSSREPWWPGEYEIDNGDPTSEPPITATGRISGYMSNLSFVTGQFGMNGTSITSHTFGFSGIAGTWTSFGQFSSSTYQGVTTYTQYYMQTISMPWGTNATQMYVLYGNIYNGQATVQGMPVFP